MFNSIKYTGRRTSLIVDPPDGKIPALTPEAQKRNSIEREYRLALLQSASPCKNQEPSCRGGKYGPPSPRRTETPPNYLAASVNRSDGPEDRSLGERCITFGTPSLRAGYNSYYQIVQTPGYVIILMEMAHDARIIPLDARPHLSSTVHQWMGDSRGHWEGDTLVVDTTNYAPQGFQATSSAKLHVVRDDAGLQPQSHGPSANWRRVSRRS